MPTIAGLPGNPAGQRGRKAVRMGDASLVEQFRNLRGNIGFADADRAGHEQHWHGRSYHVRSVATLADGVQHGALGLAGNRAAKTTARYWRHELRRRAKA